MKYKCIKDTWIKDIKVMNEGDIIVVSEDKEQVYNISTSNLILTNINDLIKNLVHMSDNCENSTCNCKHGVTHSFQEITNKMFQTYLKKNKDYGNAFDKSLDKWGLSVAAIRLGDKLNRFESFVKNGSFSINDEGVRDTLMDLSTYAIMTIMYLDNQK